MNTRTKLFSLFLLATPLLVACNAPGTEYVNCPALILNDGIIVGEEEAEFQQSFSLPSGQIVKQDFYHGPKGSTANVRVMQVVCFGRGSTAESRRRDRL